MEDLLLNLDKEVNYSFEVCFDIYFDEVFCVMLKEYDVDVDLVINIYKVVF